MQVTEEQAKTFPYPQLSTTTPSIRLVHLERGSTGYIIAQLKTFSAEDVKNGYRAVSYVWGSKTFSNHIIINNHPFPILDNLHQILEVICDDERLRQSWWWIDSICINQGEGLQVELERNSQVAMMKDIYENAQMVLGWLGPGSTETEEAIKFLHVLKKTRNSLDAQKDNKNKMLFSEISDRKKWKSVEMLFLRDWWERVWTLQEYIVPTMFEFYCGKSSISREDMKVAVYAINLSLSIDKSLMSRSAYGRAWNRRRLYMWYRNGLPMTLLGLIAYVGHYRSSNPRDRIYSVLGIVSDGDLVGQPKYGDHVEDVYVDLVRNFAEKHKSLDVICLSDRFNYTVVEGDNPAKLPTWCPDWRAKDLSWVMPAMVCQSSGIIGNFRPTNTVPGQGEVVATYGAGNCEGPPKFSFSKDHTIACQGIFIDRVDGMGGLKVVKYRDNGANRKEVYGYVQSEKHMRQPCGLEPTAASAILSNVTRCLMLDRKDRYLSQGLSGRHYHKHLKDLCSIALQTPEQGDPSFMDWFERNRHLNIQGYSLEAVCKMSVDFDSEYDGGITSREAFISRFADTTKYMSRRLTTTINGHLGMVPGRTRKGDQIWVLHGCSVPVVLRKREKDDAFELVGECYLNNFMNGEAFDLLDGDDRRNVENIRIA